jgi:hypothetical protein
MTLKGFVRIAVIASVVTFLVVMVAKANAQEGVNFGEGMPPVAEPTTANPDTMVASQPSIEEKPIQTTETASASVETPAAEPVPGHSADEPLFVKMVDGRPKAVDRTGRVVVIHRSGGGCRRSEAWHKDIEQYRGGETKDQKVQWSAISTAQATANKALKAAGKGNLGLFGLLGLLGGLGLLGWKHFAPRRVYY